MSFVPGCSHCSHFFYERDMAYRVALPKNKENFAEKAKSQGSDSLPKNTGNTGNKPACFNCGAAMTPTTDIYGKPWLECRACAVGDGTDRPNGVVGAGADVVEQIIENGEVVAVLICSKILEAPISGSPSMTTSIRKTARRFSMLTSLDS